MDVFRFQYEHNTVYQQYANSLNVRIGNVKSIQEIPFLPIEFHKNHTIKSTNFEAEKIYKSSGTGDIGRSKHHVADNDFYLRHALNLFTQYYGPIEDFIIIAVLPSYQEQGDSSLISMVDYFINKSANDLSGYYLGKPEEIASLLPKLNQSGKKVLFLGVTYALLELADSKPDLSGLIVMETGGMKGRGREMIREELHAHLCASFNVDSIHSEYGMTELLSQAYSKGKGYFRLPKSMKIIIRDVNDPFHYVSNDKTGGINIIDLANVNSCSFIETKDLGRSLDGDFYEIMGRFDNSDLRGCNLLLV
ncbi:MAG: acyl transferase [Bacteroidota bacterium]